MISNSMLLYKTHSGDRVESRCFKCKSNRFQRMEEPRPPLISMLSAGEQVLYSMSTKSKTKVFFTITLKIVN